MTDPTVFLTGFPGFLGEALAERLLERYPAETTLSCLVQSRYRSAAETRAAEVEGRPPGSEGSRIDLYEGDIRESDLGLGDACDRLQGRTVEAYHLAAVYDLGVERDLARAVNVEGTGNVCAFAADCQDLRRLQYVSTCYVSGRHDGVYTAADLDVGQPFSNHYEATKFAAERVVRERMADGLPATVYRPAITVGDSRTGETRKYDGPYDVIRYVDRHPGPVPVPTFGDPRRVEVNVVPRDYVVDAIDRLSRLDRSAGETYQLCDPNPPTVAAMLRAVARATDTRIVRVPLPRRAARWSRRRLGALYRRLGIDPYVVDYFVHPTSYTAGTTRRDLPDHRPPPFESYVDRLVGFARAHPDLDGGPMA